MQSQSHIEIQQGLDTEFKKHDLRFKMRSFRNDTDQVFKELDEIRRMQITLASEHISLENNNDNTKLNINYFNKKEADFKNMISKLDDLGNSVNRFLGDY
ncbi:hypothetical protein BJ944DRAFT_262165 [Cunninghamella echinulata]|nr:hypothetical protein BJ944DRAFT_262165 [Cunninghamella echinulata]